jgi:hypothetical protein
MLSPFSRIVHLSDTEKFSYHLTENKLRVETSRFMLFTEIIVYYKNLTKHMAYSVCAPAVELSSDQIRGLYGYHCSSSLQGRIVLQATVHHI